MLSANDSEYLLRGVMASNHDAFELYCARESSVTTVVERKLTRVMRSTSAGIMLRAVKSGEKIQVSRNDLNLARALFSLGVKYPDSVLGPAFTREASSDESPLTDESAHRITRWAGERAVSYTQRDYRYFVLFGDRGQGSGREEAVELTWPGGRRVGSSIEDFWRDWNSEVQSPQDVSYTNWPMPGGKISILWSPRALGQLLAPFFRHFESDRVLSNRSWLTRISFPQPYHFDLVDEGLGQSDHQGVQEQRLMLFQDGRPRSLACNHHTAKGLGVAPTGHARRSNYLLPPTIGFWRLKLLGHELIEDSLKALGNGIRVTDASFDETESIIQIHVAQLVHQGDLGERIEPIHLRLPLEKFLSSLKVFSKSAVAVGIETRKAGHHLITNCEMPWGISTDIESDGRGAYW